MPKLSALFIILIALFLIAKTIYGRLNIPSLVNKLKEKLPERFYSILEKFISGLMVVKNKKEFAKVLSLSLIVWCIEISLLAVISRSLELNLSSIGIPIQKRPLSSINLFQEKSVTRRPM